MRALLFAALVAAFSLLSPTAYAQGALAAENVSDSLVGKNVYINAICPRPQIEIVVDLMTSEPLNVVGRLVPDGCVVLGPQFAPIAETISGPFADSDGDTFYVVRLLTPTEYGDWFAIAWPDFNVVDPDEQSI